MFNETLLTANQDYVIEIFKNGEWIAIGQDRNGPSESTRIKIFNSLSEAKKSALHRQLNDQGFEEKLGNLRFIARDEASHSSSDI